MKDLEFQLSVQEANLVIKALGQLPFNQVNELIGKIHQQASTQISSGAGSVSTNGKAQANVHTTE